MFEVSAVKNGTKARTGTLGPILGYLGPRFVALGSRLGVRGKA